MRTRRIYIYTQKPGRFRQIVCRFRISKKMTAFCGRKSANGEHLIMEEKHPAALPPPDAGFVIQTNRVWLIC
jgi:hypothetical protein